jgi:acyl-CoA synthetase (AMP-forming)/AMP-acid ligase II
MPIYEVLERHRRENPLAIATSGDNGELNYRELANQVDAVAKSLVASGVEKGDRIVTLAPPCEAFWISYLATVSIGAVWSGLNPRYRSLEYQARLQALQPKVVFTCSVLDGRDYCREMQDAVDTFADDFSAEVVSFESPETSTVVRYDSFLARGNSITGDSYESCRNDVADDDIAVIVYTSGSTGLPKGAMLSHGAMLRCASTSARWLGDSLEKAIMAYPINHIGGLNGLCMNVFMYGGCIRFLARFSIPDVIEIGERENITFVGHGQTTLAMLVDTEGFDLTKMRACRTLIHGGSKTSEKTLAYFWPLDAAITSVYAQTESCGYILRSLRDASLDVAANTLGKPLDGVDIRIVDPQTGEVLKPGDVGELQAKFDWIFSGYFNNAEATEEAITSDGYLRTGDLCKIRPDGNIELVDRIKQMFKSGGHSIFPAEIEQAICLHPSIALAAVLGVDDDRFGTVGLAFITAKAGTSIDIEEVSEFLKERIANYKVPKHYRVLSEMPTLPNTKIDKQALKELGNALPRERTCN